MSGKTHPVYIDEGRKRTVKSEAAALDLSMKEVIQRLASHGIELGLHEVPEDVDITEVYEGLTEDEIEALTPTDVEEELEELEG